MNAKLFWYVLIFLALFVNENTVQWALAVSVGNMSVGDGFLDAFKYFSLPGYAFFTAFRAIPYLILVSIVKSSIKKDRWATTGIAWGGLLGILFLIVLGSWDSQHAYYTDQHVSSTTAIAFIFIPIYAIVTGFIGGLVGVFLMFLKKKFAVKPEV
jgi:hypothetical protein